MSMYIKIYLYNNNHSVRDGLEPLYSMRVGDTSKWLSWHRYENILAAQNSHTQSARSAQKRLRLFCEKSTILVRFRSISGLEHLWIPNEEFM